MRLFIILILLFNFVSGQFLSSDPYYLLREEKINNLDNNYFIQTTIRPLIYNNKNHWSLKIRSEIYYNNGAPNLENKSNRFIGKGLSSFNSINFTYLGKFTFFSIEPYYFTSQNREIEMLKREEVFMYLNDVRYTDMMPYIRSGLRETQFYFKFNQFAVGLSNANMWWGPGLHTSLTMTNNSTGFPHLMIGTVEEKKIGNIGFNFRYIRSQFFKTVNDPLYAAFVFRTTFYTEPLITIGFNKNILFPSNNKEPINHELVSSISDFSSSKIQEDNYQTIATYFILDFPKSGLKVFFELGTTDQWEDLNDFFNYPDHGIGSLIGFRQYGVFNNQNLIMGIEYARLALSSFWEDRAAPNWYGNSLFGYSSYDGRRWAAHSGSDSDDFYMYFGYLSDKWSFVSAFNYERHGILYTRPAEVKMEVDLEFRYKWKNYWLNLFFEKEWLEHAGFVPNRWRIGNVIWFGVERDMTNIFYNKLGLVKN